MAKRAGERSELFVSREGAALWKDEQKGSQGWEMDGDLHAKVDDDDVTVRVIGMVKDVLGSVK